MECARACVGGWSHTITLNAIGSKKPKLFDLCVLWEGKPTKWHICMGNCVRWCVGYGGGPEFSRLSHPDSCWIAARTL